MLSNKRIQTFATQCAKNYNNALKLSQPCRNLMIKSSSNYNRSVYKFSAVQMSTSAGEPSEKVAKLADEVLSLDLLEINQLLKYLQKKLNIPDDQFVVGGLTAGGASAGSAAPAAAAAEPPKVKDTFNVKIGAVDQKAKIKIIKEVRVITGLGLKEAKELVEKAPVVIKEGVKKEEADILKKVLLDAGAEVELV